MTLLLTSDDLGGTIVRTSETGPLLAYVSHPKGSRRWHIYVSSATGSSPTRTTKRLVDVLPALEELLADEIAAAAPAEVDDEAVRAAALRSVIDGFAWRGGPRSEAPAPVEEVAEVAPVDEVEEPGWGWPDRTTRVKRVEFGDGWQVQYRDPSLGGLWCDFGDPVASEREAIEKEATVNVERPAPEERAAFEPVGGPFRHESGATGRATTAFARPGTVNVVWTDGFNTVGVFTLAEFRAECEPIEEEEPEPAGPSVTVGNVLVVRATTGSGTVGNPFDGDQCEHVSGPDRAKALRLFRAGLPVDGLGFWRHMPSARPVERSEVRWDTMGATESLAWPSTEADRLRRACRLRALDADERRAVELADKLPPVGRRVVVDVVTLGTESVEGTVVEHVDLPAGSSRVLRATTVPAAVLVTDEGRAVTFPAGVVRSWSEVEAVPAGR